MATLLQADSSIVGTVGGQRNYIRSAAQLSEWGKGVIMISFITTGENILYKSYETHLPNTL